MQLHKYEDQQGDLITVTSEQDVKEAFEQYEQLVRKGAKKGQPATPLKCFLQQEGMESNPEPLTVEPKKRPFSKSTPPAPITRVKSEDGQEVGQHSAKKKKNQKATKKKSDLSSSDGSLDTKTPKQKPLQLTTSKLKPHKTKDKEAQNFDPASDSSSEATKEIPPGRKIRQPLSVDTSFGSGDHNEVRSSHCSLTTTHFYLSPRRRMNSNLTEKCQESVPTPCPYPLNLLQFAHRPIAHEGLMLESSNPQHYRLLIAICHLLCHRCFLLMN